MNLSPVSMTSQARIIFHTSYNLLTTMVSWLFCELDRTFVATGTTLVYILNLFFVKLFSSASLKCKVNLQCYSYSYRYMVSLFNRIALNLSVLKHKVSLFIQHSLSIELDAEVLNIK